MHINRSIACLGPQMHGKALIMQHRPCCTHDRSVLLLNNPILLWVMRCYELSSNSFFAIEVFEFARDVFTTIIAPERFHTDVCGPFSVASTMKHRHYVIFVDDFSRKCWIFFMQKKSETYSKFYEFKALVEKESGKQVKALRSDNGGEYISGEFKDFCSKEGIRRELIAPHNPQ